MLAILNTLDWMWNFTLLVVGFGLVIFVHELGHFVAAKAVGIKVEQFAIGFGNAAFSWRQGIGVRAGSTQAEYERRLSEGAPEHEISETEYRFNWFPLGGYVKMLGQDDFDPTATSDDPRAFSSKPVWARMVVISAGVIMNLIFAVILFVIAFMFGVDVVSPVVGAVDPTSHAADVMPADAVVEEPGLQAGDRIVRINGDPVRSFSDVQMGAALALSGRPVRIDVERNGRPLTFDIRPEPGQEELLQIGVFPTSGVTLVEAKSNADRVEFDLALERLGLGETGLEPGMRLARVNDEPIEAYWQLAQIVDRSGGKPVEVEFVRPGAGEPIVLTLEPRPEMETIAVPVDNVVVSVDHVIGLTAAQEVRQLAERGGAASVGIEPGDIIIRIGDIPWPRFDQIVSVARGHAGGMIPIEVERNGERQSFDTPVSREGTIGIYPAPHLASPIVAQILETVAGSGEGGPHPTAAANLACPPGTEITEVNGQSVRDWSELQLALREATDPESESSTVELTMILPYPERPQETIAWVIPRDDVASLHRDAWEVKLGPGLFTPLMVKLKADDPAHAVALGFHRTKRMLIMTYLTLDRLIRGSIKIQNLKGPVGIAELGTRVAYEGGILYLIMFLAIINVNLAVINFLPIPVLDGGWFVLLTIEKIKGSPVSERTRNVATTIGFLFIATVILITFYNDVANLIRGLLA